MSDVTARVADATGNWVDTHAPSWSRPYLRLSRFDRPMKVDRDNAVFNLNVRFAWQVFRNSNINIARMEVGRAGRGQQAMILLSVDDPVKADVLDEIRKAINAHDVRAVTLP